MSKLRELARDVIERRVLADEPTRQLILELGIWLVTLAEQYKNEELAQRLYALADTYSRDPATAEPGPAADPMTLRELLRLPKDDEP